MRSRRGNAQPAIPVQCLEARQHPSSGHSEMSSYKACTAGAWIASSISLRSMFEVHDTMAVLRIFGSITLVIVQASAVESPSLGTSVLMVCCL